MMDLQRPVYDLLLIWGRNLMHLDGVLYLSEGHNTRRVFAIVASWMTWR